MRRIHPTNHIRNLFLRDVMLSLSASPVIIMHRMVDIGVVLAVILITQVEFINFPCLLFRITMIYISP